jgi:hypothetical protein
MTTSGAGSGTARLRMTAARVTVGCWSHVHSTCITYTLIYAGPRPLSLEVMLHLLRHVETHHPPLIYMPSYLV